MMPKEVIEKGLSSIGKIKIIHALAKENKMMTVYLLHKKTALKRDDIKSSLDDLVTIGWVKEAKYANVLYRLNLENEYVIKLVQFLKDTGYMD